MRTRILVREIMNSPVITSSPRESVKSLAAKMTKFKVGSVVIMKSNRPAGIVTNGDVISKVVAKGFIPSKARAEKVMSQPLFSIDCEKDVTEAARLMRKYKVKHLGVTYKDQLAGMISVSDLVAVTPELIDIVSEKARIVTGESRRQRGYVSGYCDTCNQWSDLLMDVDGKFLCEECRSGAREEHP